MISKGASETMYPARLHEQDTMLKHRLTIPSWILQACIWFGGLSLDQSFRRHLCLHRCHLARRPALGLDRLESNRRSRRPS